MTEFTRRCDKAVGELEQLAMQRLAEKNTLEYQRLMGKAEGVRLAKSYAEELERIEGMQAAIEALKNAGEQS